MIEQLKELEQEAMDNLEPETYDAIVSNVLDDYDQQVYQSGYIDGLQTAIRMLSDNSDTMSYTMEIDEMFGDDYARADEDEDTN
jgi:ribosomal protein L11 methylase PrmA